MKTLPSRWGWLAVTAAAVLVLHPAGASAQSAPLAYVTNERSCDVTVINTATNQVVATIPVEGGRPRGIRVSPDGKLGYAFEHVPVILRPRRPRLRSDEV